MSKAPGSGHPKPALAATALTACLLFFGAYSIWHPGKTVTDGRHDLGANGIWLQHGWLGDDKWFASSGKMKSMFRDSDKISALASLLSQHGIKDVFPHLCPTDPSGFVAALDDDQAEILLDHFDGFRVLPWVGGVVGKQAFPASAIWRANFTSSIRGLLARHPRFAGIHLNIEPVPSGDQDFMTLLEELRRAMPRNKMLSVAAHHPPTLWQPFSEVHWEESYYAQLASSVDQFAIMMYDTSIILDKAYQAAVSSWTRDVLSWAGNAQVLLGLPAYDDTGVGYHTPRVENLRNGLLGVHAGLDSSVRVPANYRGIAVYCEWEMDDAEWQLLQRLFLRISPYS